MVYRWMISVFGWAFTLPTRNISMQKQIRIVRQTILTFSIRFSSFSEGGVCRSAHNHFVGNFWTWDQLWDLASIWNSYWRSPLSEKHESILEGTLSDIQKAIANPGPPFTTSGGLTRGGYTQCRVQNGDDWVVIPVEALGTGVSYNFCHRNQCISRPWCFPGWSKL